MTKAEIFTKKASDIIKESIKSVVYIDEKAWNPFDGEKYNSSVNEHVISKTLYKELKKQGINLNIHKFEKGDESKSLQSTLKQFLFNDIDLVLLDWDLDEIAMNVSALKLLNDIIIQPHIHFCCIYSATPSFDDIIKKVISYFSGLNIAQYDQLNALVEDKDEIIGILKLIDISKKPVGAVVGQIMKINNDLLDNVTNITKLDKLESIKRLAIAIDNSLPKPDIAHSYPFEIISGTESEYTITINNTIVTILKKSKNTPKDLIKNFSGHIAADKNKSFLKLLGLDMQNQFSKYGAFLNPEILNISFNTFMHHRKQINSSGAKPNFEDFIKDLLIENSRLNLVSADLKLLENAFLEKFKVVKKNVKIADLASINCFYNGVRISVNKQLNFGDIFKNEDDNDYYICITALCDCLHPDKIKNKFFFVKNTALISINKALDLGDTSHISYIDKDTCVKWSGEGEFVKPRQYFVPISEIVNDKLIIKDWELEGPKTINLTYVFSLKQSYTQRIANQAFSHPIRVGVDFVKK